MASDDQLESRRRQSAARCTSDDIFPDTHCRDSYTNFTQFAYSTVLGLGEVLYKVLDSTVYFTVQYFTHFTPFSQN